MSKELYRGDFNISGGEEQEFAFAYSEEQAKVEMARRIAAQRGVYPVVILGYLRHHPHSYKIKLEVKICQKSSEYSTAIQPSLNGMGTQQLSA